MITRRTATGSGREGFAMAATLLIVLTLTIIALGAAWLASSERKTSHAESVHLRALFSADSGTESAINFLRLSDDPPTWIDASQAVRQVDDEHIEGSQSFDYDCTFVQAELKPGWEEGYHDYVYRVTALGEAGAQGESGVQAFVARLFRDGY
jgi:Tfp pilus assembly protein PilX